MKITTLIFKNKNRGSSFDKNHPESFFKLEAYPKIRIMSLSNFFAKNHLKITA